MSQLEEKDVQAFNELQARVIENSEKHKFTQQQLQVSHQQVRRAVLTAAELERVPEDTACYEAVGKAYILAPKKELLSNLEQSAKASSAEIKRLDEAQQGLKNSMEEIERDVRELLRNSPALARAYAGISQ